MEVDNRVKPKSAWSSNDDGDVGKVIFKIIAKIIVKDRSRRFNQPRRRMFFSSFVCFLSFSLDSPYSTSSTGPDHILRFIIKHSLSHNLLLFQTL